LGELEVYTLFKGGVLYEEVSLHLEISEIHVWFESQTPYLVHEGSITPHITSSGVLLVVESLQAYNTVTIRT
jgi:hypothetical protein